MQRLQRVHNELQDKNEIAIYDKYGTVAKRVTIIIICKKRLAFIIAILHQC